MSKSVLVTGATGNQGGALLNALANHSDFTILAVTRNPSSSGAQKLLSKAKNVKLVQGDQNDVPGLFRNAQEAAKGGLWGVYSVQVSQGKGVTHDGEIEQGKAMVDESVKAGVKHFVYSSVERGGDEESWNNKTTVPHFQSKHEIEHHLRDHAGSMGWTVLRPVAFMDNLAPGFPTKVFITALNNTLGEKSMQWVSVADIGVFAKLAFENPQQYNHKAIGLAGDELTKEQFSQAFQNKTGVPLDGTFWVFGSILKYMVGELGLMIDWFGREGYRANIPELKRSHPGLLTLEAWIEKESSFPKA